MLNDAYHEHQELKEKYKLLEDEHNSALKYIEFLKEINEASQRHCQQLHEAFVSVMEKYIENI